ncbi:hypothetical protein OPKNFCMD_4703 [Methylobacterium crusticola]|uniref:Uncharacterized protein n=1 Tax=Methylobacterium crusticola TaxID=1697972 RepID=A0ABQ4R3A4_9HYPH|nr:hypothetical protein OPKNFCMD_4703 [Methylobacterium crusticola]
MNPVATSTESRAWRASATVKKRIRMCGRPAVPKISATPRDTAETGSFTRPPGAMMAWLRGWSATARANSASRLKPKRARIRPDIRAVPDRSRTALMICTQVVARMPPKAT